MNGDPLANVDCELIVDGQKKMLKTGSDGRIDEPLPILAQAGSVIFAGEEFRLQIGHLDPLEEESGQRARLANLGYYFGSGADIDPEQLRFAVEEFQCDHDLAVDGVCGPNTRKKLLEVHGC